MGSTKAYTVGQLIINMARTSSIRKYDTNTVRHKQDWKSNSIASADKYARVMARFGANFRKAKAGYLKGVRKTSPNKFASSVRGKGRKWKQKLKEAVC